MVMQSEVKPLPPPLALDLEKWGKYEMCREPFAKVSESALPLIDANYDETGQFQSDVPLDVDWDGMFFYESRGELISFSLRLAETREMIGYAAYLLTPTLHSKSTMHAISDVIYLAPQWRQGLLAVKFMGFCERHCKQAGAKVMHTIMKSVNAPRTTRMMERQGHKIYEVTYMKVL